MKIKIKKSSWFRMLTFGLVLALLCGTIYSFAGEGFNDTDINSANTATSSAIQDQSQTDDTGNDESGTDTKKSTSSESPVPTGLKTQANEELDDNEVDVTYYIGDEEYYKETIEKNTLSDRPEDPAPLDEDTPFLYWHKKNEEKKPFSEYTVIKEDTDLYAKFGNNSVVYFHDTDGSEAELMEVDDDGIVNEPTFKPDLDIGEVVDYWYEKDSPEKPFVFGSKTEKSIHLYPKVKAEDRAVAYFITNGMAVEPQTGKEGFKATDPTKGANPVKMQRTGYNFTRWSATENGTTAFNFNTPIKGVTKIYAVWTPVKVGYTINYWNEKENIVDDPGDPRDQSNLGNYELLYSQQIDAAAGLQTGTKHTITNTVANGANGYKKGGLSVSNIMDYSDFEYSETKTISGKGNTVINVYYKRIPYKFTFDLSLSFDNKNAAGTAGWAKQKDNEKKYRENELTIYAKLGQDVSSLWPSEVGRDDNSKLVFMNWNDAVRSGLKKMTITTIAREFNGKALGRTKNKEATLKPKWITPVYTFTYVYYGENIPGNDEGVSFTPGNATTPKKYSLISDDLAYDTYVNEPVVADPTTWYYNYWMAQFTGFVTPATADNKNYMEAVRVGTTNHYNINFYAPRSQYNVTLMSNGGSYSDKGSFSGTDARLTNTLYYEQDLPALPTPSKDGDVFTGWYTDEKCTDKFDPKDYKGIMPAEALTLYAGYKGIDAAIKYYDGDDIIKTNAVKFGDYVYQHDLTGTDYDGLEIGDKVAGKGTFKGWYYEAGQNKIMVEFPLGCEVEKAEYALHAKWEREKYTVTYYVKDGFFGFYQREDSVTVQSGSKNTLALSGHKLLQIPKKGNTQKWTTEMFGGGNIFTSSTRITADTNVYIMYKINTYKATFDPQGGEPAPSAQDLNYDDKIDSPARVTKPQYLFTGWNTKADGTGKTWSFEEDTMPDSDVTLYAVWMPVSYGVKFDTMGGSANPDPAKYTVPNQTVSDLPDAPTKEGNMFRGWFTEQNGKGTEYTNGYVVSDDQTVYADWEAVPAENPGDDPGTGGGNDGEDLNPNVDSEPTSALGGPDTSYPAGNSGTTNNNATSSKNVSAATSTVSELISNGTVPTTNVGDREVPLYSKGLFDSWALLNLILCVAGGLLAIYTTLRAILRRNREEVGKTNKSRISWLIATALFAVGGIVLFLLTENTGATMVIADMWTVGNAFLFAASVIGMIFVLKKEKEEESSTVVM